MHPKYFYKILADVLFVVHVVFLVLVIVGFLFPKLWYAYMTALVLTFVSDILFSHCLMSKWEFDLRKKYDPSVDYNYTFASYYTYKLTNHKMSDKFYRMAAIVFLGLAISINLYFKFWA